MVEASRASGRVGTVVGVVLVAWFLAAVGLGFSGVLPGLPMPLPQLLVAFLVSVLGLLAWKVPAFRAWLAELHLAALVAPHLTRFVGVAFLVLHAQGRLPRSWALPAGWGDIFIAVGAVLLLVQLAMDGEVDGKLLMAWNWLGLLDILFVVLTAAFTAMREPTSLSELLRLPLCLLPTFLVPIVIFCHLVLAWRLWPGSEQTRAGLPS